MQLRYLGFDQQQNVRSYRFEVTEEGQPRRRFTVNADMPCSSHIVSASRKVPLSPRAN